MECVLFFDLDETLVRQEDAFCGAYRATAEWYASEVAEVDISEFASRMPVSAEAVLEDSPMAPVVRRCRFGGRDLLWGEPGHVGPATQAISQSIEAFRTDAWQRVLRSSGGDDEPVCAELGKRFRQAMFAHLGLFSDVSTTLQRLSRDCRMAVITNGMGLAQREKIAHLGLSEYFEVIVASAEVGHGKPARPVFDAALRSMGVAADGAFMIGDSLEGDVRGAQAAGITSVWLNRRGQACDSTVPQVTGLFDWAPDFDGTGRRSPAGLE